MGNCCGPTAEQKEENARKEAAQREEARQKAAAAAEQRMAPIICGQAELPIPAGQKILFGPVDKPVRRESTNLAVALKSMTNTEA